MALDELCLIASTMKNVQSNPYQPPNTNPEAPATRTTSSAKTWRMGMIFGLLAPVAVYLGFIGVFIWGQFEQGINFAILFDASLGFLSLSSLDWLRLL